MGTRQAERGKIKRFDLDFWKFHPTGWTACLAVSSHDAFGNPSLGLHNRTAWASILIEIGTLGEIPTVTTVCLLMTREMLALDAVISAVWDTSYPCIIGHYSGKKEELLAIELKRLVD